MLSSLPKLSSTLSIIPTCTKYMRVYLFPFSFPAKTSRPAFDFHAPTLLYYFPRFRGTIHCLLVSVPHHDTLSNEGGKFFTLLGSTLSGKVLSYLILKMPSLRTSSRHELSPDYYPVPRFTSSCSIQQA